MKKLRTLHIFAFLLFAFSSNANASNMNYVITTNFGEIFIELDMERAPKTVENFASYADEGFYDETIFHRVISGFMIQGGGFTASLDQKTTKGSIDNEARNGLKNSRGTIAMARSDDPNSATSQFFINVADNSFLDHTGTVDSRSWGYAVFGRVVSGMDVVDKIANVKTGPKKPLPKDVPLETIVIHSVKKIEKTEGGLVLGAAETECFRSTMAFEPEVRRALFIECMAAKGYKFDLEIGEPESICFQVGQSEGESQKRRAQDCMKNFGY